MNILLVEDDRDLCDTLSEVLQSKGHTLSEAYNAHTAFEALYEHSYEILILDINLPDGKGFDVLKEAKKYYPNIAALFMTALDTPEHLEESFASGGDDYIRKPFRIEELLFRIDAIAKRLYKLQNTMVKIGSDFSYDTNHKKLYQNDKELPLKPKVASLLHILCTHTNEYVSREEIESLLWEGEELPDAAILRIYIKELRILLGQELITNQRGVGYKLDIH